MTYHATIYQPETHSYRYSNVNIEHCECQRYHDFARYRWFIRETHKPTGQPYAEDECGHYVTLADAKVSIEESQRHESA